MKSRFEGGCQMKTQKELKDLYMEIVKTEVWQTV